MYKYIIVIRARLCPVTWVEDAWTPQNASQRHFMLTRMSEAQALRYESQEDAQADADTIYEANKGYGLTTTVQAVLA